MFKNRIGPVILLITLLCASACETAYYGINEQFGRLKNDILVDRVEDAMTAQEEAKEEFRDALEQFEAVVGTPDSELKSVYRKLNGAYEDAEAKASEVSGRIEAVADVADDLFAEWQNEIEEYSDGDLRRKSAAQLRTSQARANDLLKAMRKAETRMGPVLTSFKDHVLFLKHNLNAQAIAALKSELGGIEVNVGRLIREMEVSIDEAQSFIRELEGTG